VLHDVATDKRILLLRTGQELFSRYGYKDVSIADITRVAGIATGSFYTWFPGKDEFYDRVLDRLEQEGIREIEERVALLSSPVGKLKALLRFAALGVRNRPLLRGFITGDRRFLYPGRRERLERPETLRNHLARRIAELIEEGARKGDMRSRLFRDPVSAVTAILDAIFLRMDREDVDDLLHDMQLIIQRGLGRRIRFPPTGQLLDQKRISRLDTGPSRQRPRGSAS
jgi:AcrR family transcriptional regulator